MALRLRRGTEQERGLITPLQGELLFVTDTKKIYVGDGVTQGGVLIGPYELENDTSPTLNGDLDLNSNDITGTGNIDITGNIDATGNIHADGNITANGNITLGNNPADSINIGGLITSDLRPSVDDAYDLGTGTNMWRNIWATAVSIDSTLAVGSRIIALGNTANADSSRTLWDIESDQIYGNLNGSVYSDDSSLLMVDANNGIIEANEATSPIIKTDFISTTGTQVGADGTLRLNLTDGVAERFNIEGRTDGTYGDIPVVSVRAYKNTLASKGDTVADEQVGGWGFEAYNNGSYKLVTNILGKWHANADFTKAFPGAEVNFLVPNNTDTFPTIFNFNGVEGTFTAPVLKAGSYATGDIPTGADVGAGSIVFDSTTNEFKGWNGTSWVVLG